MAGGRSSRFGENKLLKPINGKPIVQFLAEKLTELGEVIVVTKTPISFSCIGKKVRIIVETADLFSPLVGIALALREAKNDKVLILPGDTPLVKFSVIRRILENHIPPAVVTEGERFHSLFSLLLKSHTVQVEALLKAGKHKISELHRTIKSNPIDFKLLQPLDYSKDSLVNINKKEDYVEAILGRAYRQSC